MLQTQTPPISSSFPPVTYHGRPVLTTEMLAQAYEVKPIQIQQNYANNKDRFVEGKHFFKISGNELREFKNYFEDFEVVNIPPRTPHFTLWTERGAARHAKMLNSDRAWDVFEILEETFFAVNKKPEISTQASDQLSCAVRTGVHLHTLDFRALKVRAATKDGSLWIAVNDLGPALGYAAASGWLPAELPALWEGVLGRDSYDGTWRIVSPRQGKCCVPKVRMLSEEAVHAMIERCTKPRAQGFEAWLKDEVIPGLREEGWYGRVEALAESPAPMALPAVVKDETPECPVQDSGVSQEAFQIYLRRMEQQRRIVEELLGEIHIGAKPYLLATAREQARRGGSEDISLAMAYLNPFDEARDAFARGFRITRHMTQAASILSGRQGA